jgi:LPXTG-motif cell wall-anchored protein
MSFTKNGEYCCLGLCKAVEKKESSSGGYGWIWAIIIFIVLGGGGYYFYKRQKKVAPKKPAEQLKESTEKFAKRLEGTKETKRITGGLAKT